jgi:hypothetical protein
MYIQVIFYGFETKKDFVQSQQYRKTGVLNFPGCLTFCLTKAFCNTHKFVHKLFGEWQI